MSQSPRASRPPRRSRPENHSSSAKKPKDATATTDTAKRPAKGAVRDAARDGKAGAGQKSGALRDTRGKKDATAGTPGKKPAKPVARGAISGTPDGIDALLRGAGLVCPKGALPPLTAYVNTLLRWNERMNLVGARTFQTAVLDLVADSVRLAAFLDTLPLEENPLCLDPGAGAGLPGVPLRCLWTRGSYHMVEVREKRALFLAQTLDIVRGAAAPDFPVLVDTHARRADVNDVLKELAERGQGVDLVVSRAFLPWEKVLALFGNALSAKGLVVFMSRGEPAAEELAAKAQGFVRVGGLSYPSPAGERVFWAVGRAGEKV